MYMPMKRCLAEVFGTFAVVFAGTGALIIDEVTGGTVSHVGVALTFGLVVMTMIYALGDVSGAHLNPAVTIGFWAARRISFRRVAAYVASQCVGAVAASLVLRQLFVASRGLGATSPSGTDVQSLVLEAVMTCLLMFVILSVSTGAKEKGIAAGIAVGGTVALEALFAGPISGASMNPARSLGPALASNHWSHLWIYLIAPVVGALLGVVACCGIRESPCCCGAATRAGAAS